MGNEGMFGSIIRGIMRFEIPFRGNARDIGGIRAK